VLLVDEIISSLAYPCHFLQQIFTTILGNLGSKYMSEITSLSETTIESPPVRILGAFGVGCFHFGLKPKSQIRPQHYAEKLQTHLSNYPNIDNINIEDCDEWEFDPDHIDDDENEDKDKMWSLNGAIGIYPCPRYGKVSFRVHLPNNIRDRLLSEFGYSAHGNNFDVCIHYAMDGLPVAFVEGHSKKQTNPSALVILLREYLRA
jgi:hypothetical protein